MSAQIYLDYNATAKPRPEVLERMAEIAAQPLNASSVHHYGRKGHQIIEQARRQIADLTEAEANNVIFNSGATEGNNTVLKHFNRQKVLASATEHLAVLEAREDNIQIPVHSSGLLDMDALESLLIEHKPALVSCMLVNNETGIIQPIREISNLVQKYGAYLHCDAVQAAGRIPIDINVLGIHFMTLSSHKIGGPQGVGALILGQCGETPTLLHGGGQEKKARAGTENTASIAGFGLAAEIVAKEIETYHARLSALRDRLEAGLGTISPDIKIYGQDVPRVANTSFFALPGTSSQTLLMGLDLAGICVSNGSACSSGTVRESYVLKAMGAPEDHTGSAIRVSLGWDSTNEDIDAVLNAFGKIVARL